MADAAAEAGVVAPPPDAATAPQQVFRWEAIDGSSGQRRLGETAGTSAYEVRATLRKAGLQVERMDPVVVRQPPRWAAGFARAWQGRQRGARRLARADLCDALATLLEAGMPLEQALAGLAASTARPIAERRLLRDLRDQVRAGTALSEAVAAHPDWFDAFDAALLRSGQQAGDLVAALQSLATVHLRAGALGQKLAAALAYPAILLIAGLAVWQFMSLRVLPQLADLLIQGHHQPPWLTMAVMGLGRGLATWWPLALVAAVALAVLTRRLAARLPGASALARLAALTPWARFRAKARVALIALALARLRRGGVTLLDALQVVAETVADRAVRAVLIAGMDALRRGEDLSTVLAAASPTIDAEFAQLVQVGEQSGELTTMLERIGERYQRAADRAAERLAAVLGPLAILVLAGLIGVLVMACILPLARLGDLV
jgi:type II secretory pathway component PulF